jgi:hypothetical protein
MKFLVMTLVSSGPGPITGRTPSRFQADVDPALRAAIPGRPLAGPLRRAADDTLPAESSGPAVAAAP